MKSVRIDLFKFKIHFNKNRDLCLEYENRSDCRIADYSYTGTNSKRGNCYFIIWLQSRLYHRERNQENRLSLTSMLPAILGTFARIYEGVLTGPEEGKQQGVLVKSVSGIKT